RNNQGSRGKPGYGLRVGRVREERSYKAGVGRDRTPSHIGSRRTFCPGALQAALLVFLSARLFRLEEGSRTRPRAEARFSLLRDTPLERTMEGHGSGQERDV